ncbi:MAG TPA: hypothetical protein VMN39_02265 [Longimicrobiaceae bacterium]|nr:hypothetical protein [Longimicrobiaceae bacterium]
MGANLKPTLSLLKGMRRIIGGVKTFVVRLFVPAEAEAHVAAGQLRGLVEEIGSDRRARFGKTRELLAFLAQRGGDEGTLPARADAGRAQGGR